MDYREFFRVAAEKLLKTLSQNEEEIFGLLITQEEDSSSALSPYTAIPHVVREGDTPCTVLLARSREGIRFSDNAPEAKTVFVLAGLKKRTQPPPPCTTCYSAAPT